MTVEPIPAINSRWRHADGGRYKVTGYRLHKDRSTGEWITVVEYDHDDGTTNPRGLAYSTDVKRWYERFEPV